MNSLVISTAAVARLINTLKISSSAGDDDINSKIAKATKDLSSSIIVAIFSQSLRHHHVPNDWKIGKGILVLKGGDRNYPSNYRHISLTSTSFKRLEHIIYSHIMNFLELNNVIFIYQHLLRKSFSCEAQLAGFIHDIRSQIDFGG